MTLETTALYRLGKRSNFWAALTPSSHGLGQTWQFSVAARSRGGAKVTAPLIETTALRPLGTVTIKGEAYPLLINWHKKVRGGGLNFGGMRKTGSNGGSLEWEMRWIPLPGSEDGFRVEMRLQATPRGTGHVHISLPTTLHQPALWSLQAAMGSGHCAQIVRSAYSAHAVSFAALCGDAGWDETGVFNLDLTRLPLGGGKLIQFGLLFGAAKTEEDARAALVKFYTAFADTGLHSCECVTPLDPHPAAARLLDPTAHVVKGAERVYLLPPMKDEEETYYAGLPHEPVGAMAALWNQNRIQPDERIPRLVRFGASGICADFQIMGAAGEAEPNKGAFWDKLVRGEGRDESGGLTHGLRSNARLARSLFQVYAATHDPLCRQSALNICHWLMLKQSDKGFYNGARTLASRGLPDDGRMVAQPCSLDGVEVIRAFTLAYKETTNEVWIKAAWRIANFLMENRLREFDAQSPPTVAAVILSLLALDREAPNARLRNALSEWGAWLRAIPLSPCLPSLNADGLHAGLYECAEAGFALFSLTRESAYLRYAFSALALVPPEARSASWRAMAAHSQALIALAGLLPESRLGFDAQSVTMDWRVYAPDPAASGYVRVQPAGGDGWVESLPLVCRANDQLLLLLLAPPSVEAVTLWKNGKRPLVRDLLTGALDTSTSLHLIGKEKWARVGLFTIDA